jgi:hypothetical protein
MSIVDQAKTSTLSLQDKTPETPLNATAQSTNLTVTSLVKSQLDLGVANPEKYLDKKPQ